MTFGRQETESLIREVKKRHILWDYSGEHYYDKQRKHKAWVEVCAVLLSDFKAMSASRQKVVLRSVMSRWRTIRDNFVRKRKKLMTQPNKGRKKKKYLFDDQLSFLKKLSGRRTSHGSTNNISNPELSNTQFDECQDENVSGKVVAEQSLSDSYLPDECLPEQSIPPDPNPIDEFVPDQSHSNAIAHQSPKKEFEEPPALSENRFIELVERYEPPQPPSFDEDMSFFYSLLPSVRKLNSVQKFDFRMETMRFLQNQLRQLPNDAAQTRESGGFQIAELPADSKMFLPEND